MVAIQDEWAAVQFDLCCSLVGNAIESALEELHNFGSEDHPDWKPKYRLRDLLDQDFRIEVVSEIEEIVGDIAGVQGIIYDQIG